MSESMRDAARRLTQGLLSKGYKPAGLFPYYDQGGNVTHVHIRLDPSPGSGERKAMPWMHMNGAGWELKAPAFSGLWPLYNLHLLAQRPIETVWVTEGEKCAEALRKFGLLTTTSGGTDTARKADWSPLKGRDIIVWRDNDEPGLCYAKEVSDKLGTFDCRLQWVDVPKESLIK